MLEGTLAGDEDAFAELVGRYRNQITSYIYRMMSDYDSAVDLAQETFIRVYRAAGQVPDDACFLDLHLPHRDQPRDQRTAKAQTSPAGLSDRTDDSPDGEEAMDFQPPDGKPLQDVVLVDAESGRWSNRPLQLCRKDIGRRSFSRCGRKEL